MEFVQSLIHIENLLACPVMIQYTQIVEVWLFILCSTYVVYIDTAVYW